MKTHPRSHGDKELIYLKLGGSLITDKHSPRTPRLDVLDRLALEIQAGLRENPGMQILLGHGSGSFGHTSGNQYQTREGVSTPEEWTGFTEVWGDAADLNRLVMRALQSTGLPAVAFPPSASVLTRNRQIISWDLSPLQSALNNNLIPVVFGDVVFDESLGGTILSTEELFVYLAASLTPRRILLAGRDPGVWRDFPACTRLYQSISLTERQHLKDKISSSAATDVTGGMGDKVNQMLDLISTLPNLEALIFSGEESVQLKQALAGESPGTRLHS